VAIDAEFRQTPPDFASELSAMVDPSSLGDHLDFAAFLEVVRKRRESLGLTLVEVAKRMGVDHAAVSRLESGKQANPTINTVMRYVEAVGSRVVWAISDLEDQAQIPRGGERERRRIRGRHGDAQAPSEEEQHEVAREIAVKS